MMRRASATPRRPVCFAAQHIVLVNSLLLAAARVPDNVCVANASSSAVRETGMWAVRARLSAIAATIALFSFADPPAFARGSQAAHDAPVNSERIERLPPEVRDAVIHMCGDPRAGHYFATYFDNSHLIRLHFEQLYCDGRKKFCRGEDCLHNEYISTGGHYLIRSYYGRNND
jgi:hypothetical protein